MFRCNHHYQGEHYLSLLMLQLILLKFYYQLMYKRIHLKGVLKFTLKQLQHYSV
jgi:hypothetical protein